MCCSLACLQLCARCVCERGKSNEERNRWLRNDRLRERERTCPLSECSGVAFPHVTRMRRDYVHAADRRSRWNGGRDGGGGRGGRVAKAGEGCGGETNEEERRESGRERRDTRLTRHSHASFNLISRLRVLHTLGPITNIRRLDPQSPPD